MAPFENCVLHAETRDAVNDVDVRSLLTDLGINEADPSSIITALTNISDKDSFGECNSNNAKRLLKQSDTILNSAKYIVIGGPITAYDPNSQTIYIGTLRRSSWGTANTIIEVLTQLIHTVNPATQAERAKLIAQINNSRDLLPAFTEYLRNDPAGVDLDELIADIHCSLGYQVLQNLNGSYYFRDLLNGSSDDEYVALNKFRTRTLTDPFTLRVLGEKKDFTDGLFASAAKNRFIRTYYVKPKPLSLPVRILLIMLLFAFIFIFSKTCGQPPSRP
jgi:hypothetical protein